MNQPAWDADLECRHGRMPFDPSPSPDGKWAHDVPCPCFPAEQPGYTVPSAEVVELKPRKARDVARRRLCACGCGGLTSGRWVDGRTTMYVAGHNRRKRAA